jgi:hypothetical protein
VDWLVANGYTKPGQIGIRGAPTALRGAGDDHRVPTLFNAAVDITTANVTFLKNTAPYRRAIRRPSTAP